MAEKINDLELLQRIGVGGTQFRIDGRLAGGGNYDIVLGVVDQVRAPAVLPSDASSELPKLIRGLVRLSGASDRHSC